MVLLQRIPFAAPKKALQKRAIEATLDSPERNCDTSYVEAPKERVWVGTAKDDLERFPKLVQRGAGHRPRKAAEGLPMLVLHGSWVLSRDDVPARFVVWGETTEPPRTTSARGLRGARPRTPVAAHPFAPKTHRLVDAFIRLGALDEADKLFARSLVVQLPSAQGAPLASPTLAGDYGDEAGGSELRAWRVDGLVFDAAQIPGILMALTGEAPADVMVGDDLRYWIEASRFALELASRLHQLPALREGADDVHRVSALAFSMPPACRALAWDVGAAPAQPIVLLTEYLNAVVDAPGRRADYRGAQEPFRASVSLEIPPGSEGPAPPLPVEPRAFWSLRPGAPPADSEIG